MKLCEVCVRLLYVKFLYVKLLYVKFLYVKLLYVTFVCVKFVRVLSLCVRGRRREDEEEERGLQNQKQEPHTKLWGKTKTPHVNAGEQKPHTSSNNDV